MAAQLTRVERGARSAASTPATSRVGEVETTRKLGGTVARTPLEQCADVGARRAPARAIQGRAPCVARVWAGAPPRGGERAVRRAGGNWAIVEAPSSESDTIEAIAFPKLGGTATLTLALRACPSPASRRFAGEGDSHLPLAGGRWRVPRT